MGAEERVLPASTATNVTGCGGNMVVMMMMMMMLAIVRLIVRIIVMVVVIILQFLSPYLVIIERRSERDRRSLPCSHEFAGTCWRPAMKLRRV